MALIAIASRWHRSITSCSARFRFIARVTLVSTGSVQDFAGARFLDAVGVLLMGESPMGGVQGLTAKHPDDLYQAQIRSARALRGTSIMPGCTDPGSRWPRGVRPAARRPG
jgi:hypothetical protein